VGPQLAALQLCWALGACSTASNASVGGAPAKQPVRDKSSFDPRDFYARAALFVRRGAASFYADKFAGRRTANGELYDPNAYTAAHRSLPFGSIVRVIHEKTGAWVLVRVNDRGPYGPRGRILDLSKQAARRLSMLGEGVARIRLEVLQLGQ
jgi:rare lipoprotein A (peptidoglycan hydrolase)